RHLGRKLSLAGEGVTHRTVLIDGQALATTPARTLVSTAIGQLRIAIETVYSTGHNPIGEVAYLRLADNSRGPLLSRQRGLSPPVVRSRNGLSAPYAALLSCLSTHRSCLLTYQSRAVGRSFAWCIRYRTWGCGQGGTR